MFHYKCSKLFDKHVEERAFLFHQYFFSEIL